MNILPKISIVTVTYNAANYLEQTIQSVIAQDYPNIEYIIIDGASTDGTVEIIKKYEHSLRYWTSEVDQGIYDAMNKGIKVATGEWINFMNAGDSFCERNTVSQVVLHCPHDVDILFGDIYLCCDNTREYRKAPGLSKAYEGMFCWHQAMFSKTDICKKNLFDTSFKIAADYDFAMKCLHAGYKFYYVHMAVANFLNGGVSSQELLKARIEDIFIQSKYLENMEDIFAKASFLQLQTLQKNNNRFFAHLINEFDKQMQELKLREKRFVLYGYGHVGRIIKERYCDQIIAIVDQNFELLSEHRVDAPKKLTTLDFDFVLISVLGREKDITEYLVNDLNVPVHKILTFSF